VSEHDLEYRCFRAGAPRMSSRVSRSTLDGLPPNVLGGDFAARAAALGGALPTKLRTPCLRSQPTRRIAPPR